MVAAAVEVQVEVVVVADHGVAEPVGGHGELQGQKERLGKGVVDLVPQLEDAVDDGGVGDPLEEVLDDDVLVVLTQHAPRLGEGAALIDEPVVGLEEGQVLGDDQVLVVAGIPDPGGAVVGEVELRGLGRSLSSPLPLGRSDGFSVPCSEVTRPISILLRLGKARGAGGPYSWSSSRVAVRRFFRSLWILSRGRGARLVASSLAVVKEPDSRVMSWSTNWPK